MTMMMTMMMMMMMMTMMIIIIMLIIIIIMIITTTRDSWAKMLNYVASKYKRDRVKLLAVVEHNLTVDISGKKWPKPE